MSHVPCIRRQIGPPDLLAFPPEQTAQTTQTMINIDSYFSDNKLEHVNFLARAAPQDAHPSPVWMGRAKPTHTLFPIKQIDLHIQDSPCSSESTVSTIDDDGPISISKFLAFVKGQGHDELLTFAKDLTTTLQSTPYDAQYITTTGCGDGFFKVLQVFLNPGDTVLVENYSYTPIYGPVKSLGGSLATFPVVFESKGPVVDVPALEDTLENWSTGKNKHLKKPKIIYLVPTQNPLGVTQPQEVKEKIYALCQKHDILIVEDDPDGYIHMDDIDTYDDYKKEMTGSSYLSLDVDGRVIRMETFSKLFFGGIRLGFIAAREEVIKKLDLYTNIFTKPASGISQAVFLKTIEHFGGGADAYLKWCYEVSKEYKARRDVIFESFKNCESVQKGYLNPIEPDGGMFYAMQINFNEGADISEEMEKFYRQLLKSGVTVVVGGDMASEEESKKNANFVRLSNVNFVTPEDCKVAAERLNAAALEFFEGKQ